MSWVAVVAFWVVFLVGFSLVLRPRYERLSRRREVLGDVSLPRGKQLRTFAICCVGAVAAMGTAVLAGLGWPGILAGSVVLAAVFITVVTLTIRDGYRAQDAAARRGASRGPVR